MQYVNQLTEVTPDLSLKVAMGSEMYINRLKRPMISSIRDLDLAATAQGTWGWLTPTKQESQLVSFPCPGIRIGHLSCALAVRLCLSRNFAYKAADIFGLLWEPKISDYLRLAASLSADVD